MIGLDSMMPWKLVKLHANDAPRMTPCFKELIIIVKKPWKKTTSCSSSFIETESTVKGK
jgi:hypothetical protein